jgi:hypothetical protein
MFKGIEHLEKVLSLKKNQLTINGEELESLDVPMLHCVLLIIFT